MKVFLPTETENQRVLKGLSDTLLLDCSQDTAPVVDSIPFDPTSNPAAVSPVDQSTPLPFAADIQNDVTLNGLGFIGAWWPSGDPATDPHAYETVTNTDVSAAVSKCGTAKFDEILKSACICSFLANRAVVNENPVNHQWFTDDQGYQQLDFDKILRYYAQVASTGQGKNALIPYYTQDPERVIKFLASALASGYSEDYIRVVFYWLSRTWTSIVHPAVMEPSEANRNNTSQAAKTYLGNSKAIVEQAQHDSAKNDCMVFGIDWCQVGTFLKWIAVIAGLGLGAYIVWEVTSVFRAKG